MPAPPHREECHASGEERKGIATTTEPAVASFMPCSHAAQALRARSRTPYWEVRGGAFPFRSRTPVHTSETADATLNPRAARSSQDPNAGSDRGAADPLQQIERIRRDDRMSAGSARQ